MGLYSRTDATLFNVVVAAERSGAGDDLDRLIQADLKSDRPWRKARAIVAQGFRAEADVDENSLNGSQMTHLWLPRARQQAARRAASNRTARHWFRRFVSASSPDEAHAAWILMLQVVDQRIREWAGKEINDHGPLSPLREAHLILNNHDLNRAIDKNEKGLDKQFLYEAL